MKGDFKMQNKNDLDAFQYVTACIIDAIADITQILTTTKAETFKSTIEDMTVTIPTMVNIPAETNLKALQKTIKNMVDKTKVEAIQQTIDHMADATIDITTILPNTEVEELKKAIQSTSSSIGTITEIFLQLDWDNFEPTDEDVKEARDIISSENIKETITKSLSDKKGGSQLTTAHKTVILDLMLLYHTIIFISDAATLAVIESRPKK